VAVLVDDSSSMRVPDVGNKNDPQARLSAVQNLLAGHDGDLLRTLSKKHNIRLYRFDRDATPVGEVLPPPVDSKDPVNLAPAVSAIGDLKPEGDSTQVLPSILSVMQDLQGQRVAGVVVLTDGRDTPAHNIANSLDELKNYGEKVYPICVGSDPAAQEYPGPKHGAGRCGFQRRCRQRQSDGARQRV